MIRTVLLVEWGLIIFAVVLVITQIIVPALNSEPLFPILRKRARDMENLLAQVNEERQLDELHDKIRDLAPKPTKRTDRKGRK